MLEGLDIFHFWQMEIAKSASFETKTCKNPLPDGYASYESLVLTRAMVL